MPDDDDDDDGDDGKDDYMVYKGRSPHCLFFLIMKRWGWPDDDGAGERG